MYGIYKTMGSGYPTKVDGALDLQDAKNKLAGWADAESNAGATVQWDRRAGLIVGQFTSFHDNITARFFGAPL